MAIKRSEEPSGPIVKQFTPEELDRAIEKLKRRVTEVEVLKTANVRYEDQQVRTAEHNIRDAVLEIFGPRSPEYSAHGHHEIYHGGSSINDEEHEVEVNFKAGIPQSLKMLGGLISRLEEKRIELKGSPESRAQASLDGMDIHPRVAEAAVDLYKDGHYPDAVFAGAKALVNYVKEKSGRDDLDGAPLVRTVFSINGPILAVNDLKDQSDKDEQEGLMHFFEGAVLALRNPRGHSGRTDTAQGALESIVILSYLAKNVQKARKAK